MTEELDYELEAAAQKAFAKAYADNDEILVPRVVAAVPRVLVTEWLDGTPLSTVISSGSSAQRDLAGLRLASLHFSAPCLVGLLHADPHPGNFRLLDDGRLGVLDFGAVARLPGGHPEPVGRLSRLAIEGKAEEVLAGLRAEGFVRGDAEIDAQGVLDFITPMLEPIRSEEFQFTRAWLRAEAVRVANPRGPGLSAWSQPEPAAGIHAHPPGHARLHRRPVPAGGAGSVPQRGRALAARFRRACHPSCDRPLSL